MRRLVLSITSAVALLGSLEAAARSAPPAPPAGFEAAAQPAAQTAPAATAAPSLAEQTRPLAITKLLMSGTTATNKPSKVTARIDRLKDDPRLRGKDLSAIELGGNAIPTRQGSAQNLKIRWTTVSHSETEERKLLSQPLETDLDPAAAATASKSVEATGDQDALIETILELLDDRPDEPRQAEKEDEDSSRNTASAAPPAAGGRESRNDIAGNYQTDPIKEEAEDPLPIFSTTSDGCSVRIDEAQGRVFLQEQTVIDGAAQNDCDDTLTSFPIQQDYSLCADVLEIDALTATAQYRRFYVGRDLGTSYIDQDCQPDAGLVFDIVEDEASCGWATDPDAMTATKLVRLFYTNRGNQRVEVSSCQPSAVIPTGDMILNTSVCDPRNGNAETFERGQLTWMYQNVEQASGTCIDTGTTWAHFEDAEVCSDIVDMDNSAVYPQSRTAYINAGNQKVYVDPTCSPVMDSSYALLSTTASCEATFVDDFPAQVSYATHKFYYEKNGGMHFVTDCVKNDEVSHQHQERVTGWVNDDVKMEALPETEVFITAYNGEIVRQAATVRSDAVAVPYELDRIDEVPDEVSYNGCDKTTTTVEAEVYLRPDSTTYSREIGPGQPIGPVFACTVTAAPYWKVVSSTTKVVKDGARVPSGNCYDQIVDRLERKGTYTGYRPVSREDGATFTQKSTKSHKKTFTKPRDYLCKTYQTEDAYIYTVKHADSYSYPKATSPLHGLDSWDSAEGW